MVDKNKNIKDLGRISPHSFEAEEAVLGCMLINNEAVSKVIQELNSTSFYKSSNAIIFDSMVELFNNDMNIDYISLVDQLKKKKQLKSIGGSYFITGLSKNAPSAENVQYYIQIVKEKAILREIISVSINISSEAYDSKEDAVNILDKAEQILFTVSQNAQKKRFTKIEPILHTVLDNWGNRKSGTLTGVPSGFYDLDNLLSGFQNNDLIVLAGRPSMGKTALALNFARNCSVENNFKIGFFIYKK